MKVSEMDFFQASAADDPEHFAMCVECGDRPWGYGYCGELCSVCAHRAEREEAMC